MECAKTISVSPLRISILNFSTIAGSAVVQDRDAMSTSPLFGCLKIIRLLDGV